ncbi:MAG TPA: putative cytokinetic ring protein SteA [Armatimonadota bacterium]|nr:putative cytokinetic ring protein SteA [Armatimonadota bacterium]
MRSEPRVAGILRVDRRTKQLCQRLKRGEIAVIDHPDLDGTSAYALLERRPVAVVNAARSTTGRYPNGGPGILLQERIPLLDACGPELLESVRDGQKAELRGDELWVDGVRLARGSLLTPEALEEQLERARGNLRHELQAFSQNTLEYLAREKELAVADLPMPALSVSFRNRPVLVVVRGDGHKRDLQMIQPYVREQKPVLVGVDGGADALLEAGLKPHLIVGDMDSASEAALRCGAELVVHTYADGRPSPGLARTEELGLKAVELSAPGTSEDVAMLIAFQGGAALIVAVGTHFSLVEFLDKRRAGMASTFLTRLKVGSILVDAKGLSCLYQPALSPALAASIFLSALLPIIVVVASSAGLQRWLGLLGMSVEVWLRRHGLR